MNDLFAVVEHNQASGHPTAVEVFTYDATEAREFRDDAEQRNRADGRLETYRVYLLEPVEEDDNR